MKLRIWANALAALAWAHVSGVQGAVCDWQLMGMSSLLACLYGWLAVDNASRDGREAGQAHGIGMAERALARETILLEVVRQLAVAVGQAEEARPAEAEEQAKRAGPEPELFDLD